MPFLQNYRKVTALAVALVLMSFAVSFAHTSRPNSAVEYKFRVHNKSKSAVKQLLVSEDGKTYGQFDIGDGIAPGETVTLVWAKSTDNGECVQYFKAVFADGEESPAVKFDFCEKDLLLELS